jgi:hypothetical protein
MRKQSAKSRARRQVHKKSGGAAKGKARSGANAGEIDEIGKVLMVTLDAFAGQIPGGEAPDQDEAEGILFLLGNFLTELRMRAENGYPRAAGVIENFQATAADYFDEGHMDETAMSSIISVLREAGVAASEDLIESLGQVADDTPMSFEEAMAGFSEAIEEAASQCNDAFMMLGLVGEIGHGLPEEGRAMLAERLACSSNAIAREAAVLQLLAPEHSVRQAALASVTGVAANISPDSLRRLIALRNWLPEQERPGVDALIRAARAKGVDCASWRKADVEAILSSGIDGAGAQGFLIVTREGRKMRLSSVLLKTGVADAWAGETDSAAKVKSTLEFAETQTATIAVTRGYLDQAIANSLADGLGAGVTAPAELLQVAETIGGADWRPEPSDWRKAAAELLASVPQEMLDADATRDILTNSGVWAYEDGLGESWYEDDEETANLIAGIPAGKRKDAAARVLAEIIGRRREKWARMFVRSAQWLKGAADGDNDGNWRRFAILANAVANGYELDRIEVMRDVADRTIEAVSR